VAARRDEVVGPVQPHASAQPDDAEPDRLQHAPEEHVLLEAVAAVPAPDELVLQRVAVEPDLLADEGRKTVERDRLRMKGVKLLQRLQRRGGRAAKPDALEVALEIDRVVHRVRF
jgi:hypothetical protein